MTFWSKNVTSLTRGAERPFRCLDNLAQAAWDKKLWCQPPARTNALHYAPSPCAILHHSFTPFCTSRAETRSSGVSHHFAPTCCTICTLCNITITFVTFCIHILHYMRTIILHLFTPQFWTLCNLALHHICTLSFVPFIPSYCIILNHL